MLFSGPLWIGYKQLKDKTKHSLVSFSFSFSATKRISFIKEIENDDDERCWPIFYFKLITIKDISGPKRSW